MAIDYKAAGQDALRAALPQLKLVLEAKASEALTVLREAGTEAVEVGLEITQKLAEVSDQYARDEIDEASATLAFDEYLLALDNLGRQAKYTAQAQLFAKARAFFTEARDIALAVAKVALKVGAVALQQYLEGMMSKAIKF